MTRPRLIFVPLVLVMVVWAAYVAWLSRQAASGSPLIGSRKAGRVERIDAAISQLEQEMASNRR
jgi:hypothetical protein